MNIQELSSYKQGHTEALCKAIEIISKHIDIKNISDEMLDEIKNFNDSRLYEIEACIEGQQDR